LIERSDPLPVDAVELLQITRDALLDLRHVPLQFQQLAGMSRPICNRVDQSVDAGS
jgi:hypothetical protein